MKRRRLLTQALTVFFAAVFTTAALGANTLKSVSPRGLQIDATTRITLTGQFDSNPRVDLDVPGVYEQQIIDANGERVVVDVTMNRQVPAGIYPLRVVTDEGISNAFVVGVDRLQQVAFQNQIDSLPVALHGNLSGDQILKVKFHGQADQPIVIDVEGQRLGSKIRPVLRLLNAEGRQFVSARPSQNIAGDARIVTKLPTTGEFEVQLHDVVYKGPEPGWFRLKIGPLKYADLAFPPAISAESTGSVQFELSNLSTPVRVPAQANSTIIRVPWPDDKEALYTGMAPRVVLSDLGTAEYLEQDLAGQTNLELPIGISGRLLEPGEEDVYAFRVTPKSKLRFDVRSQRLGSPLDAVLVITTKDGKQLGRSDDQSATRDPGMDLTIPADVKEVVARISSLVRQHGPDTIYRLTVAPSRSQWQLGTALDRLTIPAGSRQVISLDVNRGGSKGSLDLKLPTALDSVLKLETPRIFPEDEIGLLSIRSQQATRGVFRASVAGYDSEASSAAPVVFLSSAPFPGSEHQPEQRDLLTLMINRSAPIAINWSEPEQQEGLTLARGTQHSLPLTVERNNQQGGKIRLSLLSTQKPPTKKEDNKQVPDLNRMLRIEESPLLSADQNSATLKLIAPTELPLHSWGLTIRAELLSEDEKQVKSTVYAPVLRANTISPLSLQVELPKSLTVAAGVDEPEEIKGTIERHADFSFPVQVTLQGLPKEVKLSPVTVESDETEFVIPLKLDAETKAGEFKEVRLVAQFVTSDESLKDVRSQSSPVTVKITKPE
ncbi:MAG: hypothetical protein P8N76_03620 [Pirellulaceae bacterium]|nr:hypothetical protein [Pirellulaceae bacterium]